MRAKSRRLKLEHGLDLLIIDYLQLMQGRGRFENRQQELASISRALKILAKELDVPILALSQLSRAPEARGDHRPQLSDLRESGALEQDAESSCSSFVDMGRSRTAARRSRASQKSSSASSVTGRPARASGAPQTVHTVRESGARISHGRRPGL
jgi:replicative DNA helicase